MVVGSDAGRIVILEYIPAKNMFEKVHQETFGKTGCRRIVPGQFLAVDPKGRAVMIGKNMSSVIFICIHFGYRVITFRPIWGWFLANVGHVYNEHCTSLTVNLNLLYF